MDELKQRIHQSVQNLGSRIQFLNSQKQTYLDLRNNLRFKVDTEEKVTVAISDGWFVDYKVPDAQRFLNKRIGLMEEDMKSLQKNLDSAKKAANDLGRLAEEDLETAEQSDDREQDNDGDGERQPLHNNEGLPLMEIREELDEDGNVISSSVKEQSDNFSALQGLVTDDKPAKTPQRPQTAVKESPRIQQVEEEAPNAKKSAPKSRLVKEEETTAAVKPVPQPNSKVDENPAEAPKESSSSIGTNELLELELISSEVDDEEDVEEDDEYEFEEEDDDYEEEEDEHGRHKGPLIPKLSREELDRRMKDAESALEKAKERKAGKKRVGFSSELEVKHFDKSQAANGKEPKEEEAVEEEQKPKRVSRFKAERMESGIAKHVPQSTVPATHDRVGDVTERGSVPVQAKPERVNDVGERSPLSGTSEAPVQETVTERPIAESIVERPIQESIVDRPMSESIVERSSPNANNAAHSSGNQTAKKGRTIKSTSNPSIFKDRKPVAATVPSVDSRRYNPSENEILASNVQDQQTKLDREVYERASELFQEASVTEEQFLKAHDAGGTPEEEVKSEEKTRPIVSDSVVENMADFIADDDDEEVADMGADMADVASEYQKLRNKLINKAGGFSKTEQEKAVDRLDEHGNPIKVSRFKAAQLSNRTPSRE